MAVIPSDANADFGALRRAGFTRLALYLNELPHGLDSYPDHQAKASISRGAIDALRQPIDTQALPSQLRAHFDTPPPRSAWISEVLNGAAFLAIADAAFDGEYAFLDFVYEIGRQMFAAPMYRVLMLVASPRRLAKGAHRRWSAFHRGCGYEVEILEDGTRSTFTYPPYLLDPLVLRGTLQAILAAYHAAGAPNAKGHIEDWSPTRAILAVEWGQGRAPDSMPRDQG